MHLHIPLSSQQLTCSCMTTLYPSIIYIFIIIQLKMFYFKQMGKLLHLQSIHIQDLAQTSQHEQPETSVTLESKYKSTIKPFYNSSPECNIPPCPSRCFFNFQIGTLHIILHLTADHCVLPSQTPACIFLHQKQAPSE